VPSEEGFVGRFAFASLLLVGCSSKPGPVVKEGPGVPVPPDPSGYWSGDWGRLVIRNDGGQVRGAYDHDEGTITGTMNGDTLVGWWCEVPSREPTGDAGEVELTVISGQSVDGRWKYGTDGDWREDWDLSWDEGQPPEELVARLDDPSAFCTHP
jgi:hypothetical protein